MSRFEIIKIKFEALQKDRPSAIRSSVWFGPVGLTACIIGWSLFIIGLGLIIASVTSLQLFDAVDMDKEKLTTEEAIQNGILVLQCSVGAMFFLSSLLLVFISRLCRRIVNRNIYIMELENLVEEELMENQK